MVDKGIIKYVYINTDAAKAGLLIAAIIVAGAILFGTFFHANQYARQYDANNPQVIVK